MILPQLYMQPRIKVGPGSREPGIGISSSFFIFLQLLGALIDNNPNHQRAVLLAFVGLYVSKIMSSD